MSWRVQFLDADVLAAMEAMPADIRASFARIVQLTEAHGLDSAEKGEGGKMTNRYIPADETAKEWMKDPEFRAAYDALEDEFSLASALIEARDRADMTQEQVAKAMRTTQAVVARLESGQDHAIHPHS
jgi:ribosome-binding protein aMBF1 (putative translation factor)